MQHVWCVLTCVTFHKLSEIFQDIQKTDTTFPTPMQHLRLLRCIPKVFACGGANVRNAGTGRKLRRGESRFRLAIRAYTAILSAQTQCIPPVWHLDIWWNINQTVYLSNCLSISVSISISFSTYLPTYLFIYLSTYLPIYLPTYLSIYLSYTIPSYTIHLSISIYLYLSLYISIFLYLSLSISIYLYLSLSKFNTQFQICNLCN